MYYIYIYIHIYIYIYIYIYVNIHPAQKLHPFAPDVPFAPGWGGSERLSGNAERQTTATTQNNYSSQVFGETTETG